MYFSKYFQQFENNIISILHKIFFKTLKKMLREAGECIFDSFKNATASRALRLPPDFWLIQGNEPRQIQICDKILKSI